MKPSIPFTQKGYQEILDEKIKLLKERPETVENLRKAREMGDLSENGYYKEARHRLSFLDSRLRYLERLVRFGKVMESKNSGYVGIDSQVILSINTKEITYRIVGSFESNPQKKTISYVSPLGKALMGKKEGENVEVLTPSGPVIYQILKIN